MIFGQLMHSRIGLHDASTHYALQALSENAAMHEQTRAIVKSLMQKHGVSSERQLAMECNMSQSTLHRFLKGDTETLEFQHLQTLAHYFSLTISQLIGEVPFEEDRKVRAVTLAMTQMPEYKKDMVVAATFSLAKPDDASSNGTKG